MIQNCRLLYFENNGFPNVGVLGSVVNHVDSITLAWGWLPIVAAYFSSVVFVSIFAHFTVSRMQRRWQASGHVARGLNLVGRFFIPFEIFLFASPLAFFLRELDLPTGTREPALVVAKTAMIFSAVLILIRAVSVSASLYYQRLKIDQPDNLRERRMKTQVQFLEQVADIFIVFIGIAVFLFSFQRFRSFGGSLLASAGLASVILGFSAQKSLGNLIAGFQIAFTQPIRLGDAVLVENEWGTIEEITLRYVVIQIWADLGFTTNDCSDYLLSRKALPKLDKNISKFSGPSCFIGRLHSPVEELRTELARILKGEPLWDGIASGLQVIDCNDRTMSVRILVSARNSGNTWDLRCLVREKMIVFVQRSYPDALPKTRFVKQVENQSNRAT